jgi:hypothetical protein
VFEVDVGIYTRKEAEVLQREFHRLGVPLDVVVIREKKAKFNRRIYGKKTKIYRNEKLIEMKRVKNITPRL